MAHLLRAGKLPVMLRHRHRHRHRRGQLLIPSFVSSSCAPVVPAPASPPYRKIRRQPLSERHHARDDTEYFNYGEPFFWDKTYTQEKEPIEWYQSYADIAPLIQKYISISGRVLMTGCGNSEISEHMVKDGFGDIMNIDNSLVVIESMQKKYQNIPQLKYQMMDVMDLSFDDGSFDSIIDKGTLDAIMCIEGGLYNAPVMMSEMNRVLKPGGIYLLITSGDPKSRLPYLNADVFHWNIMLHVIPKSGSQTALRGFIKEYAKPVSLNSDGTYVTKYAIDNEDQIFVFVCVKPALLE